jgi:protein-disulfide isomerase
MNNPRKNDYNHIKIHVAIVLSAVAAIFSMAGFFFGGSSEAQIFNALSKMEALKAGGNENWDKLQKLYTSNTFQQKQGQSIDAAIAQMGGDNIAPTDTNNAPKNANASTTLTPEQVSAVLKDNYIDGNADSDIVLVEYSDFECTFCQKHFDNGTVQTLLQSKKIGSIFKQFPLNFHPLAQKAAE